MNGGGVVSVTLLSHTSRQINLNETASAPVLSCCYEVFYKQMKL